MLQSPSTEKIIGAPGRSGGGGGDEDAARDSVGDRNLEREGEEQNEEEAAEDCTQSVSLSSDEESARDQEGDTPPNESSGSSGMEGHSEPEVAAEKVKYLCGEDEDTLPDRFGDRKSQVQFGEKTAVIRDFG